MLGIVIVVLIGLVVAGFLIAYYISTGGREKRTSQSKPQRASGGRHQRDTEYVAGSWLSSSEDDAPVSQSQEPEKKKDSPIYTYKTDAAPAPAAKRQKKIIEYPQNLSELYDSYAASSDGAELERKVAAILSDLPGDNLHYVLQNLYVPALIQDTTTEIDVLMIHPTGLYVFECKNYNGFIQSESPTQKFWNVSYPSGKQADLYSPVRQNRGHISCLECYLQEYDISRSWVVFGEGTVLDVPSDSSEFMLTKVHELQSDITTVLSQEQARFSPSEVERFHTLLYPRTQVSEEVKQKHIEDVMNGRIFTGGSSGENEYIGYDISEDILEELKEALHEIGRTRNKPKQSRTRAQPRHANFYPNSLSATESLSAEKMKKHQKFYDWVKKLRPRNLTEFCKILLIGNGFTSIRMPENLTDNIISAEGNGEIYLIKVSNKDKNVDGHFIESLDTRFGNNATDILIVVSSHQFAPEAITAAKKFGFTLWDGETLRCLMENVEKEGTVEQKQELQRFLDNSGYR